MTSVEGLALTLPSTHAASAEFDLTSVVRTYSDLLFRVAHSILRSRSEAEDVVQEVFLRVIEHRSKLSQIRDLRVWLVRIAWNKALDRRRRIRPDQMDESFASALIARDLPADEVLSERHRMETLLREIDRLPPKERQVLLLSAIDELGTAEMAAVLDRSESAIRALLFRARTRLRERIERGEAR